MLELLPLTVVIAAGSSESVIRRELLASNELQRHAHLIGDAAALTSTIAEQMTSVGRGEITISTHAEIQQRFAGYFRTVRYRSWDDMIPPIIRIADDGSLATMTVQKLIDLQGVGDGGSLTQHHFSQFAWDATYRNAGGQWQIVSNTSTQKSLTAEEAANARVAMSRRFALVAQPDLVPEGVAFDPTTGTTFLSSTYRRKIVAIHEDGSVSDFKAEGEDGLWSTLGMEVDEANRSLWVVSANLHDVLPMRLPDPDTHWQSEVLHYDVDSGALRGRYAIVLNGNIGLNDLCVTDEGRVFVTESVQGKILEVDRTGQPMVELSVNEPMVFPNGITHDDHGRIYVAHQTGVRLINPDSGEQTELTRPVGMAIDRFDGLAWFDGRLIGNQSYRNRILELKLNGDGNSVVSQRILEANHPAFDQPSTGEVVVFQEDDGARAAKFVYLANAQMRSAFAWPGDGPGDADGIDTATLRDDEELEDILLLEVDLMPTAWLEQASRAVR